MAEKDTYSSILAGMDSTKKSSDGESLMKGRTYIPRLSPDTREALVKALRARRKKKADEKMASRKAASDDFFASEADKAIAKEREAKSNREAAEDADIDATDREGEMNRLYEYGAEGRAATRKAKGVASEVKRRDAEARADKSNRVRYTPEQIREDNERRAKEGKEPRSNTDRFLSYLEGQETSTQREEREEREKQQEIRDLDREDITSEEIEQEQLESARPSLANLARLLEDQRFEEKRKRVRERSEEKKKLARDKKNFSADRSNIRAYRDDRSLAQSNREDLGGVSFNRNQRIFEEIQRRNMLRKARAENAARNVRRYRP
jgi:hypothetical protein